MVSGWVGVRQHVGGYIGRWRVGRQGSDTTSRNSRGLVSLRRTSVLIKYEIVPGKM